MWVARLAFLVGQPSHLPVAGCPRQCRLGVWPGDCGRSGDLPGSMSGVLHQCRQSQAVGRLSWSLGWRDGGKCPWLTVPRVHCALLLHIAVFCTVFSQLSTNHMIQLRQNMHPILHVPTTCPHYTPLCEANVVAPCTYCIQYVSFVEIFTSKSIGAFEEYGFTSNLANRYATFCFFGGILFTWVLGKLVHWITNLAYAWTAKKVFP